MRLAREDVDAAVPALEVLHTAHAEASPESCLGCRLITALDELAGAS